MPDAIPGHLWAWKLQTPALLNQATPTPGTQYTVLAATAYPCRIIDIECQATWSVQPSPLECHLTIDTIVDKASQGNPVSGTSYYVYQIPVSGGDGYAFSTSNQVARAFLIEGQSITIKVEITGGTTDPLEAKVAYALLQPV